METLQDIERAHIIKAMIKYKFNVSKCAKALGINRLTLTARIKKYGLIFPDGRRLVHEDHNNGFPDSSKCEQLPNACNGQGKL